jgi:hypothetical protein
MADLYHQLVERGVFASGEGEECIGPLQDSLLDRLWNPLRQDQRLFLVGVQSVGESVDQVVEWVVSPNVIAKIAAQSQLDGCLIYECIVR